jgi:predicted nucleotidyltransferase
MKKVEIDEKLREFTEKLEKNPKIIAVSYSGSTATKTWDKYSDVDIDVYVKDKDYDWLVKQLPKLLSMWGNINFHNHYKGIDETYAYFGKDYFKVELEPYKESWIKAGPYYKDIRIGFDKKGSLIRVHKESQKIKKSKLLHKEIVHILLDIRSNFLYVARHYARGQKLSGVSELGSIGGDLFYYLGKIKGMEGHENIRKAEKHLSKKEWNFLKISSCKSLKKDEVKRALKANWEFMKYVEKEYEKKTKRKLNLKVNDKEILKAINQILELG